MTPTQLISPNLPTWLNSDSAHLCQSWVKSDSRLITFYPIWPKVVDRGGQTLTHLSQSRVKFNSRPMSRAQPCCRVLYTQLCINTRIPSNMFNISRTDGMFGGTILINLGFATRMGGQGVSPSTFCDFNIASTGVALKNWLKKASGTSIGRPPGIDRLHVNFVWSFLVLSWSFETRRSSMDYSFCILMNANIKFSLLKSLKTAFPQTLTDWLWRKIDVYRE